MIFFKIKPLRLDPTSEALKGSLVNKINRNYAAYGGRKKGVSDPDSVC